MTAARRAEYSDNQWGGIFLTAQTGGFMVTESNRLEASWIASWPISAAIIYWDFNPRQTPWNRISRAHPTFTS
jgi:hypothetical protein